MWTIRGRVVEIREGDEAVADIDRLGKKYRGWDRYPLGEGEQRVSYLHRADRLYLDDGSMGTGPLPGGEAGASAEAPGAR